MTETNNQDPIPVQPDVDGMSLLDMLIVLAKHKKILVMQILGFSLLTLAGSFLMPNIYTGTTHILSPQQNQSSAIMIGQGSAMASAATAALMLKNPNDTYLEMLRGRIIAEKIIQRFNLQDAYHAKTLTQARNILSEKTSINSGKGNIITIEVNDRDPQRAADMANTYVDEFRNLTQTLGMSEAARRRIIFEKQLKQAKFDLADAEARFRTTQESTGLIELNQQGKAIIDSVAALRAQISAKEVAIHAMSAFATERNPELIMARKELEGLRTQMTAFERNEESGDGNIFIPTGKVPASGLEYLQKMREVKFHETLVELLTKQYEAARMDEAKDATLIQVLDKATKPEERSSPKRRQMVLVSLLAASFLSIFWVFIKEGNERVRARPEQAARLDLLKKLLWGR